MEDDESRGMGVVSYLAMALIVLVIVMVFFYGVFTSWQNKMDAQECRRSVEIHAAAHVKGMNTFEDLKCPPTYDPIKGDTSKEVSTELADSMAECFWKFGANELELFGGDLIGDNRFCALCHHVTFDSKNLKIDDFGKFLASTPVPKKYGNQYYADYLIGRSTDPAEVAEMSKPQYLTIDTSQDYGIMFVYVKDSQLHKVWSSMVGGGTGAIVGIAGGLMLIPSFGITQLGGVAILAIGTATAGATVGAEVGSDRPADWQSAVLLIPWDEEAISKLDCTQMPVPQGNK